MLRRVVSGKTRSLPVDRDLSTIFCGLQQEEAFAGLVTAPVFKTGEVSETMPGGFDSHPLPLL